MATNDEARRLNSRIRSAADTSHTTPSRLRTQIVFQRILSRLARDPRWVVKGGFSLEVRLGLAARATRDLDLWRLGEPVEDRLELQDLLDEALEIDLGDGFTFAVGVPRTMSIQDAEASTWRVPVSAAYATSLFADVSIDIVSSRDPHHEVESLAIPATIVGADFTMPAMDLHRHAAEKYHACVRVYAHDRPSTRVKDLVDLVLLLDHDLVAPERVGGSLRHVFEERNHATPPIDWPTQPPADWTMTYPPLARDSGASLTTCADAWAVVGRFYALALGKDPR
jgi:hypothetical protein